ncbi:ABC transporter ATP-binding protein/permease [Candidatus Pelagibacter ubique]|nr:ABC transporter ATP-binding protein/permease [Candidatus Pelagibacter ubique]
MSDLKKIISFLNPQEKKRGILLLALILLMAILETIGVASIMPFIAVLTNPSIIETNLILSTMFQSSIIFGIETTQQFIFALGILVFLLLLTSLSFSALTRYLQLKFIEFLRHSISTRLIEAYLNQPYSWFLNRNSSALGASILSEIAMVISMGLRPMMELLARSTVILLLFTLLIITDPILAVTVSLALGGSYWLVFKLTSSIQSRIGKESLEANRLRYAAVTEAFGASKEIKFGGLEGIYVDKYSVPSLIHAQRSATTAMLAEMPRFVLEAIAFGGMLLVILYLIAQKGTFATALPIIALYTFAGYRIMPALQRVYHSISAISFSWPTIDSLYTDYKTLKPLNAQGDKSFSSFNKTITLKNLDYQYPNTLNKVLRDVNIKITAGTSVGLVGGTGSGKTTAIDIILGLLDPQKGSLEVDDQVINKKNVRAWQRIIGYVPQHIYLTDNSIANNIAFGIDSKDINQKAVVRASKIANLHGFVTNELRNQYQTIVGERGIRLSGGQRQRIGIARALYHNPKVLILDEATSALDNLTEKAVMESLNNLNKDMTVIIIAHRLSTIKDCNIIYLLENGKIKNSGTYEELIKANDNFAKNAKN